MGRVIVPQGYTTKDWYFDHVQGVSNSKLKEVELWMEGKDKPEFSKGAARVGNLFDAMLTQPSEIDFLDNSKDDLLHALRMKKTALAHPLVRLILEHGEPQVIYQEEVEVGINGFTKKVLTKKMVDLSLEKHRIGADLKTTAAKTQKEFEAAVARFNYEQQGVFYSEPNRFDTFVIIGLSKTNTSAPPFFVIVRRGSPVFHREKERIDMLLWQYDLFEFSIAL